jgi:hypothetical protein
MQHHWQCKKNSRQVLRTFITIIVLFLSVTSYTQAPSFYNDKKKGQVYVSWGWNRGFYTKSNLHLKGADYDFTLHKIKAPADTR